MQEKKVPLEKTFIMVKPDGVKRGLVGKIFTRFENMGLKLVAARMIKPTEEQAKGNYPGTDQWLVRMGEKTHKNYNHNLEEIKADLGTTDAREIGQKVYDGLIKYLSSGPSIIMVWEGNHAINVVRKVVGEMSPDAAAAGTLRSDLGYDSPSLAIKSGRIVVQNLLHASDSQEEAEREILHWFGDKYSYLGEYDRIDYIGAFEVLQ